MGTREQIGQALEYAEPRLSVAKIHERHSERLDKFSSVVKLTTEAGVRETTIYSFRGLLEICRRSNQPKADAVMDFLYDIADEIRRTGSYSVNKEQTVFPAGIIENAKILFESAGITGNQLTLTLDKIYRKHMGYSALQAAGINLIAPVQEQFLTPTEIAETLGIGKGITGAKVINTLLENAGYQCKIAKNWELLGVGKKFGVVLDTNKKHSDGTPVRQVKWNSGILDVIRELIA